MKPGDPHWHSNVQPPALRSQDGAPDWLDSADVVIVGLGGAGVCAAIEALDAGASVIALDRFTGGGATRMSGGVVYAGGGTAQQREAGVDDDPANMYAYLKQEVGDAVREETLRHFCDTSTEMLDWLESHGVRFSGALSPIKTSYPADGCYLYHSGNEAQADYAVTARPAQRGHRTFGENLTGRYLFDALLESALAKGLKLITHAEAQRFILADDGTIEGVEFRQIAPGTKAARKLDRIAAKFGEPATLLFPKIGAKLKRQAADIMSAQSVTRSVRCDKAVILAAGGFVQNREMVEYHAPRYLGATPLGSIGCDGSGIRLGQSVGAATDRLENISAWRQFQPPRALATGIVVNARGERFVSEDCYGGTIGHAIAEQPGCAAYIIIDAELRRQAIRQAMPGKGRLFRLQGAPALMGLFLSSKKAATIEELADKCDMDPAKLREAVEHNNRAADGLEDTQFRKADTFTGKIMKPPFTAIDISIGNQRYLCPSISLGGVIVDEASGQVLGEDGQPIERLFAAGKTARGISSHRYVSGISLADCVYSGRIAGRSAAKRN
ncbi:MAG: FAD-binding protein [Blastomonas sp.]